MQTTATIIENKSTTPDADTDAEHDTAAAWLASRGFDLASMTVDELARHIRSAQELTRDARSKADKAARAAESHGTCRGHSKNSKPNRIFYLTLKPQQPRTAGAG